MPATPSPAHAVYAPPTSGHADEDQEREDADAELERRVDAQRMPPRGIIRGTAGCRGTCRP